MFLGKASHLEIHKIVIFGQVVLLFAPRSVQLLARVGVGVALWFGWLSVLNAQHDNQFWLWFLRTASVCLSVSL